MDFISNSPALEAVCAAMCLLAIVLWARYLTITVSGGILRRLFVLPAPAYALAGIAVLMLRSAGYPPHINAGAVCLGLLLMLPIAVIFHASAKRETERLERWLASE
jgi:hypothetical protein